MCTTLSEIRPSAGMKQYPFFQAIKYLQATMQCCLEVTTPATDQYSYLAWGYAQVNR